MVEAADGGALTVSDSAFRHSSAYPLYLSVTNASGVQPSLTVENNQNQAVLLKQETVNSGSHALQALPVAFVPSGAVILGSGASLTLAPGTIIKARDRYRPFVVNGGSLSASGTPDSPIIFTSIHDDTAGGDADGSSTPPTPGIWTSLQWDSGGSGVLDHCAFRYGGYLGEPMLDCETGEPSQISNCSFSYAYAWPLMIRPSRASVLGSTLTITDNGYNGVLLTSETLSPGTYTIPALPCAYTPDSAFAIGAGATVNISPGAIFKARNTYNVIRVDGGILNAIGTDSQRIVFTAFADDSVGGDTNGDGTGSTPSPDAWRSIQFLNAGSGTLAYCDFSYSGYLDLPALLADSGCFTDLAHCRFRNNGYYGVSIALAAASPTIRSCLFRDNHGGILVSTNASPVVGGNPADTNDIYLNATYGLRNQGSSCINARYNYWGANDGPNDSSTTPDACLLGGNGGSGDAVSNNVDYTSWVTSATTPPDPPVNLSPVDPSESSTASPSFTVTNCASPGNLRYHFQAATNTSFTSNLQEGTVPPGGGGSTGWTPSSPLQENRLYYWRCRTEDLDSGYASTWTDPWRVFINAVNDPPRSPALKAPASGGQVTSSTPSLSVYNATDPDDNLTMDYPLTYAFEVYSDSSLTTLVESQSGLSEGSTSTSCSLSVLLDEDRSYWWRCRANDGVNDGSWGGPWSFFVSTSNDGPPSSPTVHSPTSGSSVSSLAPQLVVNNAFDPDHDPLTYDFEVYEDLDLSNLVSSATGVVEGIGTTTEWHVGAELERSRWYWWTSRAHDSVHTGPDMEPASFFTPPFSMPAMTSHGHLPSLLADTARGDRVAYTFEAVSGDVSVVYEVYNIPVGGEGDCRVSINGVDLGTQGASCTGAWSGLRTLLLPDAHVNDAASNTLVFTCSLNLPGEPTAEWGVRKVGIDVPPPEAVTATPYDTVVDVAWTSSAAAAGYNVYRSLSPGGPFVRLNGAPLTRTLYRDTSLVNGTTYYYVVRSVSAKGFEGTDSQEVFATPDSGSGVTPVTDLRVSVSGSDLLLEWTEITTTEGVRYYRIYEVVPQSVPPLLPHRRSRDRHSGFLRPFRSGGGGGRSEPLLRRRHGGQPGPGGRPVEGGNGAFLRVPKGCLRKERSLSRIRKKRGGGRNHPAPFAVARSLTPPGGRSPRSRPRG